MCSIVRRERFQGDVKLSQGDSPGTQRMNYISGVGEGWRCTLVYVVLLQPRLL